MCPLVLTRIGRYHDKNKIDFCPWYLTKERSMEIQAFVSSWISIRLFPLTTISCFKAKKSLVPIFWNMLFPMLSLAPFSLQIFLFLHEGNCDIYSYSGQLHTSWTLCILFFCWVLIAMPEVFVFFDIPKISFCLARLALSFQDTFFTLNILHCLLFPFFPPFISLHNFVLVCILLLIIFI